MDISSRQPSRYLLLLAVFVVLLHNHGSEASAIQLSDASFEERTQSSAGNGGGPWFVLFHMPWCGYCKEMLPIWDNLAHDLSGEVSVGKVNLESNKMVAYRFRRKVVGYPTMLFLHGGKMYTYTGTRDILHLQQFAREGFRNVNENSKADIPQDPANMTVWDRMLQAVHDFFLDLQGGYKGIWANHKTELLAAISTSFSLGGLAGFFAKVFIDWMLPPLPHLAPGKKTK